MQRRLVVGLAQRQAALQPALRPPVPCTIRSQRGYSSDRCLSVATRWKGKEKAAGAGGEALSAILLVRGAKNGFVAARRQAIPAVPRRTLHSASTAASTSRKILPSSLLRSTPMPSTTAVIVLRRSFRSSPARKDMLGFGILHCSIPALKSQLLSLTRMTLLILPFWYRWKMGKRFPRASRTLLFIPVLAICLVVAIGIECVLSPTSCYGPADPVRAVNRLGRRDGDCSS